MSQSATQLGTAEAHVGIARLAAAASDATTAQQSLQAALVIYEGVLQTPEKIGGFRERCDVRCVLLFCSIEFSLSLVLMIPFSLLL